MSEIKARNARKIKAQRTRTKGIQANCAKFLAIYNTMSVCQNQLHLHKQKETKIREFNQEQERLKRKLIQQELESWREEFTIKDIKALATGPLQQDSYSVGVMASGGLLDTIASIRSGLKPIWGCETDETMQAMWQDLTGTTNQGDAFNMQLKKTRRPRIIKTGFPCQDYSELGNDKGSGCQRGQLYIKQGELINSIRPDVAIIEQTNGILREEHSQAIQELIDELDKNYYTHIKEVEMWRHGDASNRARFYIVAFNKETVPNGATYDFPVGHYDEKWSHIAQDIGVPDTEVPAEYILEGEEPGEMHMDITPKPGKIQQVGRYGEKAGQSSWPHPLQGLGGSTKHTVN